MRGKNSNVKVHGDRDENRKATGDGGFQAARELQYCARNNQWSEPCDEYNVKKAVCTGSDSAKAYGIPPTYRTSGDKHSIDHKGH